MQQGNVAAIVCAPLGIGGSVSRCNVSVTKVAHWLTANINIVRTRVRGSTDVDTIPVANIAINAGFMIHHLREVQGLEHKTAQL